MTSSKVVVTTTPSLHGWDIDAYLGPVFSHIVAGTGFFSDLAASFSDIFGGRSQSYQKQLSAINTEAIELLKSKTSMLGGNLVLALRIDLDEISGKAKQMFMVTASGTAARGTPKSSNVNNSQNSSIVTADDLENVLKKADVIKKCDSIPIRLSEEDWTFVTENQVHEIASKVLATVQHTEPDTFEDRSIKERRTKYFLALPSNYSVPVLYSGIREHPLVFPFVKNIVEQANLFDFQGVSSLLKSGELRVQKCALALARANRPYFTAEDVANYTTLVELIKSSFVERVQSIEEKSKLTSTVKLKWVCSCETRNEKDSQRCVDCGRDRYGFTVDEPTPTSTVAFLETKMKVLQQLFES